MSLSSGPPSTIPLTFVFSQNQVLGTEVRPVESGSRTLKDAINEAMRDWVTNVTTTHYCIGSAVGPHPFPLIVRELQSVIGQEARDQVCSTAQTFDDMMWFEFRPPHGTFVLTFLLFALCSL